LSAQKAIKKITVDTIKKMKNKTPIVMITAYDALFAKFLTKRLILSWWGIV